jgi:DNA-binding CsgD family transcriptional regulator
MAAAAHRTDVRDGVDTTTRRAHPRVGQELTAREIECLNGLSRGLTKVQIGNELGIAFSTVNTHLHKAYKKLDVSNGNAAVVAWLRPVQPHERQLEVDARARRVGSPGPGSLTAAIKAVANATGAQGMADSLLTLAACAEAWANILTAKEA